MGEGRGEVSGGLQQAGRPLPQPDSCQGLSTHKVRTCKRALCSEPLFPFQQKPGCFSDNTPAPLPSAQTQELPRAPRLQHQVGMHSLGSDMALGGHSEAPETASGSRVLARPSPAWRPPLSHLWEQALGLRGQMAVASPGHWPGLQGVCLPTGGRAESSLGCSEPALGEPKEG